MWVGDHVGLGDSAPRPERVWKLPPTMCPIRLFPGYALLESPGHLVRKMPSSLNGSSASVQQEEGLREPGIRRQSDPSRGDSLHLDGCLRWAGAVPWAGAPDLRAGPEPPPGRQGHAG